MPRAKGSTGFRMPNGDLSITVRRWHLRHVDDAVCRADGYTLVGLMIAVAVVNVALGLVVTSIVAVDRRAKEQELIWRGQQYVRALQCFQAESGGDAPEQLDELIEANCIRQLYPDPMVADGQWRVFRNQDLVDGTIDLLLGNFAEAVDGVGIGIGGSATGFGGSGAATQTGRPNMFENAGSTSGRSTGFGQSRGLGGQGFTGSGSTTGPGASNGIIGVGSYSQQDSVRIYRKRVRYSEWLFLAGSGS